MSDRYIEPTVEGIRAAQAQGYNVYAQTETGIHLVGNVYNDDNVDGEQETYASTTVGLRQVQAAKIHIIKYK